MGMSIDEHIGVIEDLKSTMSVCMPEPEKTEICTSLSEAIDIMRRYQKIKEIIRNHDVAWEFHHMKTTIDEIRKVVEDE